MKISFIQSPDTFTAAGAMSTPRGWGTTATLLLNGKVLIAGSTTEGSSEKSRGCE